MSAKRKQSTTVEKWTKLADVISDAIEDLKENDLDLRGGPDNWSIRETVHHLVEANLITSNIIIAALANSNRPFDWSWLNPDELWMKRLGYNKAPVEPAIETLRFLSRYIATLLDCRKGARNCEIGLLDTSDDDPRTVTVAEVLREEIEHTREHLKDVQQTRRSHAR